MKSAMKVTMRMCVGCREMKEKKDLLRVVRTSEEDIHLDLTGKCNGRGAYVCRDQACLEKAVKNHGLEKSLHCRIADEVLQKLQEELA